MGLNLDPPGAEYILSHLTELGTATDTVLWQVLAGSGIPLAG